MTIEVTEDDLVSVMRQLRTDGNGSIADDVEPSKYAAIIAAAWEVMREKHAKSMDTALGTIPYARHLVSNMPTWQIHSFLTMFCRNKEEIDAAVNSNMPMAIEYRRRVAKVKEDTEKADQ